ncbi:MAG: D-aminoacylase [Planctomycetes bacterium]|nr:D-aminoacylase [Planctomycetota bacterium]
MLRVPGRLPRALATLALASMFAGCSTSEIAAPARAPFDLVLRSVTLLDGSGTPGQRGDLAIRDGRIAALGQFDVPAGSPQLFLDGLVVAPGFVDVHTHVDAELVRQPGAENFLRMGVTTLVTGNCGSSVENLGAHFARLERGGIGPNYASLVGHGTVRRAVLGTENRAPTPAELARMQELVAAAMREGAFGMSTGLIYVPGTYAETDELIALAKVVGAHGGLYASHIRNENDQVLDAVAEALRIGEQAGVPVQISHVKCTGKPNHGRAEQVLAAVQAARRNGQRVGVDQYAYDASSTGLDVLFPADELAVDREAFGRRLRDDPTYRATIHAALLRKMDQVGFGDFRFARIATAKGNEDLNGLLLPEAAQRRLGRADRDAQAELAMDLFAAAAPARVGMIYHTLAEADVERFLREDWIAVASDARLLGGDGVDKPHPRGAGNNPRVLGRYVRERSVLPLEVAIHKMTQVPARAFGLVDRGELRVGACADLVVFDPATIADCATYDDPTEPPVGIRAVFVNGQLAVDRGQYTGVRAGAVLRHDGGNGSR